jgi:DmsE family decaheme c-type cytochrome
MVRGRPAAATLSAVLAIAVSVWFNACAMEKRSTSVLPEIVTHKVMDAHAIGSEACSDCHADQPEYYKSSYHRVAFFEKAITKGCETCHGLGSAHQEADGDIDQIVGVDDLEALGASGRSGTCLSCHQEDFPLWPTTDHALNGVSCWDCHSSDLHKPPPDVAEYKPATPRAKRDDEFCFQCHDNVRIEFKQQYHHPVTEGQMRCEDCHSIHGEPRENPILQDVNAPCLKCHPDMRGPFVFEHLALEEGCDVCHQPHGSINNKLLVTVDNSLCIRCHFQQPTGFFGRQPHTQFLQNGALCYDCHLQVHGSNTDRNFNPRRF